MAKYLNSPWGEIHGKLGDVVGTVTLGRIRVIRAYRRPKTRGTNEAIERVIKGEMENEELLVTQLNLTHAVFSTLGHIANISREQLIIPVWEPIARKLNYYSGAHLFMKTNTSYLYHSIPDRHKFYGPNNMPELETIQLTIGDLEPANITEAIYSTKTKKLSVSWNPTTYRNGTPEDNAFIIVIYWKIPESTEWYPHLKPHLTLKLWGNAITPVGKRGDAQASVSLNDSVYLNDLPLSVYLNDSMNFVIYLFFYNNSKNSYSPSSATKPQSVI